ncbi:MAG: hypothetical protein Q7R84_02930 [bacterium]|nr:hypothetical protein [bacterium]
MDGAYFFVETKVGETRSVFREIKKRVPKETESNIITGPYDIVVIVRCKKLEKIGSVETSIKTVPGVVRVVTCPIGIKK